MKGLIILVLCLSIIACYDKEPKVEISQVHDPLPVKVNPDIENSKEILEQKKQKEIECLALNTYHESRSDNLAGQFAVADVVLNRVRDIRWPNTICEVIRQGPVSDWWLTEHQRKVPIKNRCQFSWYCDGKSDEPKDNQAWQQALTVAHQIHDDNRYRGITEGATHYHASYVNPTWNKRFTPIGRIGAHLFYRAE